MKQITILELLNRSVSGESAPKVVLWDEHIFYYDKDNKEYYMRNEQEDYCLSFIDYYFKSELSLCDGYETDYNFLMTKVDIAEE